MCKQLNPSPSLTQNPQPASSSACPLLQSTSLHTLLQCCHDTWRSEHWNQGFWSKALSCKGLASLHQGGKEFLSSLWLLRPCQVPKNNSMPTYQYSSFSRSNIIYVASNHFVWRLIPVPMATQIQQLLQDKQFELALQLAVSLVP